MDNLIAEGKSILEDINVVNYEESIDRANEWLQAIELTLTDKEVVDEIYEVASRVFKPKFINVNPFFATPELHKIEEKIKFFTEKVSDILAILERQKLIF